MQTYLILDVSNLVYRTFFANLKEDKEMTVSICYHMALMTLSKYYSKYKTNNSGVNVVVAFDMPNSWRKIHTKDKGHCVTHKLYKGNRNKTLTESQKAKLGELNKNLDDLSELFKQYTGLIVLKRKYLEADDLIAGFVQEFKDDKHIIVSSDKDFLQLLDNPNVNLLDPATDKKRDLSEWDNDAKFFMFEKCFRGDTGDNVQNSYPGLRITKMREAFKDPFALVNLMEHQFEVKEVKDDKVNTYTYTTGVLYEENKLLMDLSYQPEGIREIIKSTITNAMANRGTYDYLKFIKFCGKNNLNNILNDISKFARLLSGKG